LAEAVAMVPEAERTAFQAFEASQAERKTKTITALKATGRCQMSDEALQAKTQAELDQLVALSGAPAVDYAGAGVVPQRQAAEQGVPAPRSLSAELAAKKQ
jgi:hypothetical protein